MEDPKKHPRYPYTYSADFIRSLAGYNRNGTKISRADASAIRHKLSEILNLDDEVVAKMTADYYLEHEDEISEKSAGDFLKARENDEI